LFDERAARLLDALDEAGRRTGVPHVARNSDGRVVGVLLSSADATGENLGLLRQFGNLTRLNISCPRAPMAPESLADLRNLPQLQELVLRYALPRLTRDVGLMLGDLTSLKALRLEGGAIERGALKPIEKLPNLQELSIGMTDFTDPDVEDLKSLVQLQELNLSGSGVTDKCLDAIAVLPRLERLSVYGTDITEDGVRRAGLSRRIEVRGARRERPATQAE
jgi:Leucine-rich repeat (LRR) protein